MLFIPAKNQAKRQRTTFMEALKIQIEEIVNRETRAWDTKDAGLLMTIFHPDMVWPFPRTPQSHDPMDWVMVLGRYNYDRWKTGWQQLFDSHELINNRRQIRKIEMSAEGDGAFAVVDIDTLWRDQQGNDNHWKGRVCKVYTKVGDEWKLIMHTGVLEY
jgi:ketosteroid isomerase-like protein